MFIMETEASKFVKSLLTYNGMTMEKLNTLLAEKTGVKYSAGGFRTKFGRNKITLQEAYYIAEILGYDLEFVRKK